MKTHETVRKMTDGQRGDIIATMTEAIPPDFTFEEAQGIILNKEIFRAEIRGAFAKWRLNILPDDDVWFNLEVDNDINPMDVIASGMDNPEKWQYLGPELSGKQTYQVKLVQFDYVKNLAEAKKKAEEIGCRLIEAQAIVPFKARFPKPGGKELPFVMFGGSEWQDQEGTRYVLCLKNFKDCWHLGFHRSDRGCTKWCHWLVVAK